MNYLVDRCVCFNVTFAHWLEQKRKHNWTVREACAHTLCGEACGMCSKYLAVVAATGKTELPLLIPDELAVLADE